MKYLEYPNPYYHWRRRPTWKEIDQYNHDYGDCYIEPECLTNTYNSVMVTPEILGYKHKFPLHYDEWEEPSYEEKDMFHADEELFDLFEKIKDKINCHLVLIIEKPVPCEEWDEKIQILRAHEVEKEHVGKYAIFIKENYEVALKKLTSS